MKRKRYVALLSVVLFLIAGCDPILGNIESAKLISEMTMGDVFGITIIHACLNGVMT